MRGHVYLVGAGPGDVGLITVRAVEVLRMADVVLYDRLVNPALLEYAPKEALCEYVGKDLGAPSAPRQKAIHELLINYARQGKTVVRLKGGDPFVFGRGGEEALALVGAGIPFTVVPGVSSAIAAPAYAGIPVTHRGVANAFAVFAGHEGAPGGMAESHWLAAALIPTAIFLMGVERLPLIVEKLILHGRSIETPVAIISKGTLPDQTVVVGTLGTILSLAQEIRPPSTILVGEVVNVRDCLLTGALDWDISPASSPLPKGSKRSAWHHCPSEREVAVTRDSIREIQEANHG